MGVKRGYGIITPADVWTYGGMRELSTHVYPAPTVTGMGAGASKLLLKGKNHVSAGPAVNAGDIKLQFFKVAQWYEVAVNSANSGIDNIVLSDGTNYRIITAGGCNMAELVSPYEVPT